MIQSSVGHPNTKRSIQYDVLKTLIRLKLNINRQTKENYNFIPKFRSQYRYISAKTRDDELRSKFYAVQF